MYAVTVTFRLHPETSGAFMPLMIENARLSRELEPGCQTFDICTGDDPNIVFLYEIYDDQAAFHAHLKSDHFKSFDTAVTDMIAEKAINLFHEVIR
ncbi:putative quinol monooxygenase [Cognatishimia sp. 1_MG-2023]|uniref:putative quinol monooxygenase n=1 Tax=Cognatishimia sp. 1_MG-2023 TaxID=3062642 RepID=UPI0026E1384A|nr:putative quinol monooxygenase [Cognatishimia sp. 1_MG-2023]MDO6727997.1 putative quinol monooxygenase [Cognatishimia sp. 1_MG-2023]